MGTYLATGIVQCITIDKRYQDITPGKIIEQLRNELDIDCYNYSEDVSGYYWRIKPEVLEDGLVEFLDTQFKMYKNIQDKSMETALEELDKAKNGDEIIALASSKTLIRFRLLEPIIHYIKVIRDNGFDDDITVYYSLISYFLDGKIIMECYNNILKYFEHNIRLQNEKHPLVNCVKVMITS